jgi:hypothetical protein
MNCCMSAVVTEKWILLPQGEDESTPSALVFVGEGWRQPGRLRGNVCLSFHYVSHIFVLLDTPTIEDQSIKGRQDEHDET